MPDPSLPLPNQLEIALRKIKENVRIILETRATCKSLEEVIRKICILINVLLGFIVEFIIFQYNNVYSNYNNII